jgi:DNA-binding transcriptional MerR regulator
VSSPRAPAAPRAVAWAGRRGESVAASGRNVNRYSRPLVTDTGQTAMMQIGEVAERVGLSLRTVRYYEEMGLLEPEKRTEGGFRLYTDAHVERLALIKRMKPLGFSVQEMCQLLDARDTAASPADDAAGEDARQLLAGFATAAAQRCDDLRAQLESAETLARQLRRESRAKKPARH